MCISIKSNQLKIAKQLYIYYKKQTKILLVYFLLIFIFLINITKIGVQVAFVLIHYRYACACDTY